MSFLDNIDLLSSLSQEEKNNMENFCQERKVSKGEIIFNEWDEANAMYILKTWSVSIYKKIDNETALIWKVFAEELLGEMALFMNAWKRMATAIAEEDSVLVVVLSFSISEMTRKYPIIMQKIQHIIEERVLKNKTLEK